MKISFSTLSCPRWGWGEIIASAHDLGYDGIEIRGVGKDISVPVEVAPRLVGSFSLEAEIETRPGAADGVLAAFGGGFTWGATLLRWAY